MSGGRGKKKTGIGNHCHESTNYSTNFHDCPSLLAQKVVQSSSRNAHSIKCVGLESTGMNGIEVSRALPPAVVEKYNASLKTENELTNSQPPTVTFTVSKLPLEKELVLEQHLSDAKDSSYAPPLSNSLNLGFFSGHFYS